MDNNTKLDGLEMLHAIQHTFHENESDNGDIPEDLENQIPLIVELIDRVLEEDDFDNDGYLCWIEYVLARKKSEKEPEHSKDLKLEIKQ